jgi:drug/metabolite transporter (DMT)-like permease
VIWVLVLILVCATTVGDVLRSMGMRARPTNKTYIAISTCSMAVSFFTFMKLVAVAPMSFAVPMSAAAFIPETLLAKVLLKEKVDWRRWIGVVLIVFGVALITR